jgi:hypothetical protein
MNSMKNDEQAKVDVIEFTIESFSFRGVTYISSEVQRMAQEGNTEALKLISYLLEIGSTVVKRVN